MNGNNNSRQTNRRFNNNNNINGINNYERRRRNRRSNNNNINGINNHERRTNRRFNNNNNNNINGINNHERRRRRNRRFNNNNINGVNNERRRRNRRFNNNNINENNHSVSNNENNNGRNHLSMINTSSNELINGIMDENNNFNIQELTNENKNGIIDEFNDLNINNSRNKYGVMEEINNQNTTNGNNDKNIDLIFEEDSFTKIDYESSLSDIDYSDSDSQKSNNISLPDDQLTRNLLQKKTRNSIFYRNKNIKSLTRREIEYIINLYLDSSEPELPPIYANSNDISLHSSMYKKWRCPECNFWFKTKDSLKKHLFSHPYDIQKHYCKKCDDKSDIPHIRTFFKDQVPSKHKIKKRNNNKNNINKLTPLSCVDEINRFLNRKSLESQYKSTNSDGEDIFSCQNCGLKFISFWGLDLHMQLHDIDNNRESLEVDSSGNTLLPIVIPVDIGRRLDSSYNQRNMNENEANNTRDRNEINQERSE